MFAHAISLCLFQSHALSIPLRLLRDRLLLALAVFLFSIYVFFSLFLLLRHLSPLLTAAFFVFLFSLLLLLHHHFHHLSFSFTFSLFPLCFLWQLCLPSPLALPSHLHSFPCSWPPSSSFSPLTCPYPPPLSPAPGCQTLPSRPRGKAKAVDFSPHQAFWQLYLLSLCCLCRPKCRQASLATKTFSKWQIITCKGISWQWCSRDCLEVDANVQVVNDSMPDLQPVTSYWGVDLPFHRCMTETLSNTCVVVIYWKMHVFVIPLYHHRLRW